VNKVSSKADLNEAVLQMKVQNSNCNSRRVVRRALERLLQSYPSLLIPDEDMKNRIESVVLLLKQTPKVSAGVSNPQAAAGNKSTAGANKRGREGIRDGSSGGSGNAQSVADGSDEGARVKAKARQSDESHSEMIESKRSENLGTGNKPYIVFVGQLDYKTTAEEVEEHFRVAGGVEGPMQVLN